MAEEISKMDLDAVMANQAIANVAGWAGSEWNDGGQLDEEAYRIRLKRNGPIFQKVEAEVFKFV